MTLLLRYFLIGMFSFCLSLSVTAQTTHQHKVQKKETIYGIAKMYGITVEELVEANPGMEQPGYKLKKGKWITIPAKKQEQTAVPAVPSKPDVRNRSIRMGVMLPLHNVNNDGKRMVEYYRGLLMACDSLIYAWNLPENGDVSTILNDSNASKCDIIFGPLYSRYVSALSEFVEKHQILLVIPFSINAPEVYTNRQIFQVYQTPNDIVESTSRRCSEWFKDYHPVIVDCGDSTSTKGPFTSAYRRQLEINDVKYNLTSLKSSEKDFANAFVKDKPNLVILNTSRSPDLLAVFGRLSAIKVTNPDIHISMFGYTEWMLYTPYQQANFHKYNVYIPAPFYTNLQHPMTTYLQRRYRNNFNQDMMASLPRFALTGFDHAMFFLRGLHTYGMSFDGAAGHVLNQAVQTPLKFERIGNGGLLNRAYMFIHYKEDRSVETVNY